MLIKPINAHPRTKGATHDEDGPIGLSTTARSRAAVRGNGRAERARSLMERRGA
jgi:hypothetical protein